MSARAECMIGMLGRHGMFWYPGGTQATFLPDPNGTPVAVDDACKTIVGIRRCESDACPAQAARWSLAGGPTERAGSFPEETDNASGTEAWAISGEGNVIAVNHVTPEPPGPDAAYWVDSDGSTSRMNHDAIFVTALSADGTYAAGAVSAADGGFHAAIWSHDDYWIATPPERWTLNHVSELTPNGELGFGVANGVKDGGGNFLRLFLWPRGGDVEIIPGDETVVEVTGATSSGDTVVVAVSPGALVSTRAARWRRTAGWDDLTTELLAGLSNVPAGLVLTDARISVDGRTYMGNGTLGSGQHVVWRADYRE